MDIFRQIGDARITLFNIGDFQADLVDWLRLSAKDWPPDYHHFFVKPIAVPTQCALIQVEEASILVDAPLYDLPPGSSMSLPNYQPPDDLLTQLAATGVSIETITHVIITHLHFDHYGGLAIRTDKRNVPAFPNARHYISRADWEQPSFQRALRRKNSPDSLTLGVIEAAGLIELVEGQKEIAPGMSILPAPGETPGHQLARVESEGQVLYCLGDLYHHIVEVEHPYWMAHWCDNESLISARSTLVAAALVDDALLMATHIPGLGRLAATENGISWESIYLAEETTFNSTTNP
ncbi:MAG: MBL fold metallo-hydrolase [Chloroflexota bacterium]|jgi:glyoxylase-like metal-dependent hydrolase (beta-lactamase superfamily II)